MKKWAKKQKVSEGLFLSLRFDSKTLANLIILCHLPVNLVLIWRHSSIL